MADAMEAYEEFGKKQEAAIRHTEGHLDRIEGKVNTLGDKFVEIKDYISDQEKAKLYKLHTPIDIAMLDDTEKHVLLAVLYQLSTDERDIITEEQQNYVRAVQQYLKITNPQNTIELDAVENIVDIRAQKAILQVALEFFYLGIHPDNFTEAQMDFLDCFNVNRRGHQEIKEHILSIINTVGIQGLAEKYGFKPAKEARNAKMEDALESFKRALQNVPVYYAQGKAIYVQSSDLKTSQSAWCGNDEGYTSQSECSRNAERVLRDIYDRAEEKYKKYTDAYSADSFLSGFKSHLTKFCSEMKKILEPCRTSETISVIDQINQILAADKTIEKMSRENDSLQSQYSTYFGSFTTQIEYTKDDPGDGHGGFEKLFSRAINKTRYGYELYQVKGAIEKDFQDKLDNFAKAFESTAKDQIYSQIVTPIENLLPKLYDIIRMESDSF